MKVANLPRLGGGYLVVETAVLRPSQYHLYQDRVICGSAATLMARLEQPGQPDLECLNQIEDGVLFVPKYPDVSLRPFQFEPPEAPELKFNLLSRLGLWSIKP